MFQNLLLTTAVFRHGFCVELNQALIFGSAGYDPKKCGMEDARDFSEGRG